MCTFISPRYSAEKLENPSYEDLVDIFEDRMRGWFLEPLHSLLQSGHDIAAMSLMMGYFEGIEIYFRGQDSKGKSREFFIAGFLRLFPMKYDNPLALENIVGTIYEQMRCGFAHDGIFRSHVYLSRAPKDPFWISVPKAGGQPDPCASIDSILVNPLLVYESIRNHFDEYVKILRRMCPKSETLRESFKQAIGLKWDLNDPPRAMGFTREELFGCDDTPTPANE